MRLLLGALLLCCAQTAHAHQGSIELSGLEIVASGAHIEVWVHMHAHTLKPIVQMDDSKNGIVNAAEAAAHITAWQAYIAERLVLRVEGVACTPSYGEHDIAVQNQILHTQMRYVCAQAWGALEVDNRILWEQPEQHRFLLSVLVADEEFNVMQDEKKRQSTFSLGPPPPGTPVEAANAYAARQNARAAADADAHSSGGGLGSAVWLGLEHILFGLDHVLFVFLLLVATRSVGALLAQITAFTVSHSLTLLLAAFEVVVIPAKLVESVIAASILVVAVDNVRRSRARNENTQTHTTHQKPHGWRQRSALAFGFGLVHGLGFAGALGPLAQDAGLVWLLGFNVGVEAGQLAVVLLVWPALRFGVMQRAAYPVWLRVVSAVCGVVAVWWLVERLLTPVA